MWERWSAEAEASERAVRDCVLHLLLPAPISDCSSSFHFQDPKLKNPKGERSQRVGEKQGAEWKERGESCHSAYFPTLNSDSGLH